MNTNQASYLTYLNTMIVMDHMKQNVACDLAQLEIQAVLLRRFLAKNCGRPIVI